MKPYTIHHGKLEDVLPTFEENSIDHCVTDPPYYLTSGNLKTGFMGKKWDGIDVFSTLWRSKEFVSFVGRFFMSITLELNSDAAKHVLKSVNTHSLKRIGQKKLQHAKPAESNSSKEKIANHYVHGVAFIKEDLLELLVGQSKYHTTALGEFPEHALFVFPRLFIESQPKNTVPKSVLRWLTKQQCEEQIIHLTSTEDQRMKGRIEGMTGMIFEKEFTVETIGDVVCAGNIADGKRYSVITLSLTERRKIIQWVTSLLSVMYVTQKSNGSPESFLITLAHQNWANEVYRCLKPGGYLIAFSAPKTFDMLVAGVRSSRFEIRDVIQWVFSSGFPKSFNLEGQFEGWGSALKPAYEPILIARKPLDFTIDENMKKWRTGAINIKETKIPGGGKWLYGNQPNLKGARYNPGQLTPKERYAENVTGGEDGRWPANLIHDGSEEVVNLFPESKGQQGDVKGTEPSPLTQNTFGKFKERMASPKRGDIGSAARFFYCPKTSRLDRDEGVKGPKRPINWSSGDQNPGSFQSNGTDKSAKNNHATVKPTALMRYLIRLVALPGATILDPFAGSGSTLKAAMLETCKAVAIEEDGQWMPIIKQRAEYGLRHQNTQIGLF